MLCLIIGDLLYFLELNRLRLQDRDSKLLNSKKSENSDLKL